MCFMAASGGKGRMMFRAAATLLCVVWLATSASAQSVPAKPRSRVKRAVTFLAGGALGLGIHESGHIIASAAFGASPRVDRLESGPIPFFVIGHDPVSRRKEFVISSAGFWLQHGGSEWVLTARPDLMHENAPLLKGLLAFNVGASFVYSMAAFSRAGAPERDTLGMANALGKDGVPEPVVGLLILGPAVLDSYRYLRPKATWAKWTSRGMKIAAVALTIAAGREVGRTGLWSAASRGSKPEPRYD